jgi:hypothetical protein
MENPRAQTMVSSRAVPSQARAGTLDYSRNDWRDSAPDEVSLIVGPVEIDCCSVDTPD